MIEPMFNYVLITKDEEKEVTNGGIILTDVTKEKPSTGTVVAVGPGGMVDGKEVKMEVKAGDKVMYSKYAGNEIKYEGVEYLILKQSEVLVIVE